jgi:hypothetical protein
VGFYEVPGGEGLVQGIIAIVISFALAAFLLGHENVGMHIVRRGAFVEGSTRDRARCSKLFEYMLRVEKFGVNVFRGMKFPADDEDFGRDVSIPNKDVVGEFLLYFHIGCLTLTLKKGVLLPPPFRTID